MFKRLNSYSKQHPIYKALKELGHIIRTIFVLGYIDDLELRQAIEKQLNKIENSNKFNKAVCVGEEEFQQGTKEEIDLVDGCRRLIKNALICWNYLFLSRHFKPKGRICPQKQGVDVKGKLSLLMDVLQRQGLEHQNIDYNFILNSN